jgi:ankyrin repeat protein
MVNKVSKNKLHKLVDKIKENKNLKLILKYCCKRGNSLLHILINEADIEGFKAIMCIIKEVNKVNKKLIQQIINLQNKAGDTPAHIAVRKSNNKNNIFSIMVETLQSVGADFPQVRLNVQRFEQTFSPDGTSSKGNLTLQVVLIRGAKVVDQLLIDISVPALTQDAPGGADALRQATDQAVEQMAQWLMVALKAT